MAKIRAIAREYGDDIYVEIIGDENVESIESNEPYFKDRISEMIKKGEGRIANSYHPEPNTMLQAYAALCTVFGEKDVKVEGEIGQIPYEPGVIY